MGYLYRNSIIDLIETISVKIFTARKNNNPSNPYENLVELRYLMALIVRQHSNPTIHLQPSWNIKKKL